MSDGFEVFSGGALSWWQTRPCPLAQPGDEEDKTAYGSSWFIFQDFRVLS